MPPVVTALRTRLLPALLTASGVVLITAGLLSYTNPATAGVSADASPTEVDLPSGEAPSFSFALPSLSPDGSGGAGASESPGASASPAGPAYATRVVVPALNIDLPVVAGPAGYPYCNVAMYIDGLPAPVHDLGQPGLGRATYLFAHARDGMFGPIYELAHAGQQKKMLGMIVQVYTSDDRLFLYEINKVLVHQLNLNAALTADTEQLWLQTSEGPKGTPGKTMLRADLLSVGQADDQDAHPKPKPVNCA